MKWEKSENEWEKKAYTTQRINTTRRNKIKGANKQPFSFFTKKSTVSLSKVKYKTHLHN